MPTRPELHRTLPLTQLESSANELLQGNAFVYTEDSWGTQTITDCNPVQLTTPLRVIGPLDANSNVTYRRTLSFHSYFVVRFLLIAMNWDAQTNLTITLFDQDENIVDVQFVDNRTNVPQGISMITQKHCAQDRQWTAGYRWSSALRTPE